MTSVAIVHDYLTQRGGAERVVLSMASAFPGAPIYTALHDESATYERFSDLDVRTTALDRVGLLRRHHRLALPLLAPAFSRVHVDADVTLCSSSGWAHGVKASGRKVVYCYSPAKWLYQPDRYRTGGRVGRAAMRVMRRPLHDWDQRAAASADRYLVTSTAVQGWVRDAYGIEAEIVPPPMGVDAEGPQVEVPGLGGDFFLCVNRLLEYKNVEAVVEAFRAVPAARLVVVGSGPLAAQIEAARPPNVRLLRTVSDGELRWLYGRCTALVTAAYEDYGLTPLEAASFGKPTAALRWGGFLDTVVDGTTGSLFDEPDPRSIVEAIDRVTRTPWDPELIRRHAGTFSEERFAERLHEAVSEAAS